MWILDLLQCTSEINVSIPQMADLLIERTQNSSWVVTYKALITIHHLMCFGNEVKLSGFIFNIKARKVNWLTIKHVNYCRGLVNIWHRIRANLRWTISWIEPERKALTCRLTLENMRIIWMRNAKRTNWWALIFAKSNAGKHKFIAKLMQS